MNQLTDAHFNAFPMSYRAMNQLTDTNSSVFPTPHRAIAASLEVGRDCSTSGGEQSVQRPLPTLPRVLDEDEAQLQLALQLSQQDAQDAAERQRQEEEELERILKLSLMEK